MKTESSMWPTTLTHLRNTLCLTLLAIFAVDAHARAATLVLGGTSISYGGGGFCTPGAVCTYTGTQSPDGSTVSFTGGAGPLLNGNWGCCGPDFRGTGTINGPIRAGTVLAFRFEFFVDFTPATNLTWRVVASGNLGGLSFSSNTGFQTITESQMVSGLLYYQVANDIPGNGTFTLLIDLRYTGAAATSRLSVDIPHGGTIVWTNPSTLLADADSSCEIGIGDLAVVIDNWADYGPFGDVNQNGIVGLDDAALIFGLWGATCEAPNIEPWSLTPEEFFEADSFEDLVALLSKNTASGGPIQ